MVTLWALALTILPAGIAIGLQSSFYPQVILLGGLIVFGAVFAVNSSLHSYLIVQFASKDGVSMDVGFYYMANAMGRLIGTLFSGWIYQEYGLISCLWVSCAFLLFASLISLLLPKRNQEQASL